MKEFLNLDKPISIPNAVLTIGTFDGVHVGHQKILEQINEIANQVGGESVLFTFHPHPRLVLFPESDNLRLIQTQEEKLKKLEQSGLQNIIRFPFTKEFSRLSATEFVRDYLVNKVNIHTVVIGYDHQFGRNRQGTLEVLRELSEVYDFKVEEITAQTIDAVSVSSTKIRKAIEDGEIEIANQYLEDEYLITGVIVEGAQIGRTINYPTANFGVLDKHKIVPKNGVYFVKVLVEGQVFYGMLNKGTRPTVDNDEASKIEVHIFDFNEDIYGKQIEVRFLKRIRDEHKFDSTSDLQKQLQNDEKVCRNNIGSLNR
jgi:riboflavin kinase/FMN adenylyltransferase